MEELNIQDAELSGSKLIEASAGTGKTYSVALLVLRLILEREVPIDKMLMVTFTKAATAELELRIRKFVRLAYRYASAGHSCDREITDLVDKAGKQISLSKLKPALQSLDNLSVMTIHSFCQKTIGEFTFETNQSFDFEIVTDDSLILKNATNQFVRETLNMLDYEQYKEITEDLKIEAMDKMLRNHLQGMRFLDAENYVELADIEKNKNEKYEALKKAIEDNLDKIQASDIGPRTDLGKNRSTAELFLPQFIKYCCVKKEKINHFEFIYYPYGKEYAEACDNASLIYVDFFKKASEELERIKKSKGLISYDDQIKTIHAALRNDQFKTLLKEKFDAIFIDEFQDTDKYQYEIFSEVFKGKNLFYIGDPKQSIYGWRGADLDTYKVAKGQVGDNLHTLKTNYRSTPRLLKALESLMDFSGDSEDSNMFLDKKIPFEPVQSGNKKLGDIKVNQKDVPPVTIWKFSPNDFEANYEKVANEVLMLVSGDNTINGEKICPKDIGILTRTNEEARSTKKALAKLGIPSVLRDDKRVMSSDEASLVRCLIMAALNPQRGAIYRVINLPQFGYTPCSVNPIIEEREEKTGIEATSTLTELLKLDETIHIDFFLELRNILQKEGVYNMIARFLDIYGIRKRCQNDPEGQRLLTNINHIAEILHKLERKAKLTPDELIVWLQRTQDDSNEEYQLRVESEDNAVQISTIFKAKGLQYNIVFAPFLCFFPRSYRNGQVVSFKKQTLPNDGIEQDSKEYVFTLKYTGLKQTDKALKLEQDEQENRRLIYVALTRAVYKCYISLIPKLSYGKQVESSLSTILSHFKGGSKLIEEIDVNLPETETRDEEEKIKKWNSLIQGDAPTFSPREPDAALAKDGIKVPLQVHSFSALNRSKHISVPFEKQDMGEAYDQFIFQELGRGANVGTALHSIFERLDFNKPDTWEKTLTESAKYYPNILKKEWMSHFKTLVEHTLKTNIAINGEAFRLSQVTLDKMLPELKFNFNIREGVRKDKIDKILGQEAELAGDATLQGMMTGFVDLLFEHNGRYYILDWKSNHLGNSTEKYSTECMQAAMKNSNYDLQYMIYTVASVRWLKSRIPNFSYEKHFGGVIYMFLRGVREDGTTGIFTARPDKALIDSLDEALKSSIEK